MLAGPSVGMLSSPCRHDPPPSQDWHARYTLYRHIMLLFFFSYQPFTPRLRFMGFGPLVNCGLLDPEEAEVLKLAHRSPGTVTESWIASWIEADDERGHHDEDGD